MKGKELSLTGRIFGKWLVLDAGSPTKKGERRWLCRCECGTERPVLERSLKSGGSTNCGCGRRKRASQNNRHSLDGKTFGELTVLGVAEKQRKNGGIWWTCRCSCGGTYDVPGTLLVTGRRTHCSGAVHGKNYTFRDITGQKFGKLTALCPTENRNRTSVIWHCICDCGQETEASLNELLYGNLISCGCRKKKHNEELRSYLVHVGGTSVEQLKSKKVPKDNTTGYKGVYFIRGRYTAKIVFQKKAYYLGNYDSAEEAAEARKEAEELLFDGTAAFYEKWKAKAAEDPQWARDNPINITVTQTDGKLAIQRFPAL